MTTTPPPTPRSDLDTLEHEIDAWLARERKGLWNSATSFATAFAAALVLQLAGSDFHAWTRPLLISAAAGAGVAAFEQVFPSVPRTTLAEILTKIRAH